MAKGNTNFQSWWWQIQIIKGQFLYYPILIKFFEKLMYKRIKLFIDKINIYALLSMVFGNDTQQNMKSIVKKRRLQAIISIKWWSSSWWYLKSTKPFRPMSSIGNHQYLSPKQIKLVPLPLGTPGVSHMNNIHQYPELTHMRIGR